MQVRVSMMIAENVMLFFLISHLLFHAVDCVGGIPRMYYFVGYLIFH